MEPFIDFGLIELLFVFGVTFIAIRLYGGRMTRILTLGIGVIAAIGLAFVSAGPIAKAVAILVAVLTGMNAYVILLASQQIDVRELLHQGHLEMVAKCKAFIRRVIFRPKASSELPFHDTKPLHDTF